MALRDIPKGKFPFRFEEYAKMYDQLERAAERFEALGYPALAFEMSQTRRRLSDAWEAIAQAERAGL